LPRLLWTLAYSVLLVLLTASMHNFIIGLGDVVIASVLAFAVMYVLVPIMTYLVGIIQFITGKMPKVSHNLSITEQAVTKSSPLASVTVPWSALYAVDQSKGAIFFFTSRNCAIMIPKSALASRQIAQEFFTTAKSYWQQART